MVKYELAISSSAMFSGNVFCRNQLQDQEIELANKQGDNFEAFSCKNLKEDISLLTGSMAKYLHRADDINCFLLWPMLPLAAIFFFPSQSDLRVESCKRHFDIGFLGFTYVEGCLGSNA